MLWNWAPTHLSPLRVSIVLINNTIRHMIYLPSFKNEQSKNLCTDVGLWNFKGEQYFILFI